MITKQTLDISEKLQKAMHESIDSMMEANKKLTREDCVTTFILVQMATLIESVAKPAAPSADAGIRSVCELNGMLEVLQEVKDTGIVKMRKKGMTVLVEDYIESVRYTRDLLIAKQSRPADESAPQREGV